MVRNHANAFAELGVPGTLADIDFAVLFTQADDFGFGIIGQVPVAAVFRVAAQAVVGQGFRAGINDDLARDGVADDGANELGGTVIDTHLAGRANSSRRRDMCRDGFRSFGG